MEMANRLEAMGVEKYAGLTRRSGKQGRYVPHSQHARRPGWAKAAAD